VELNFGYKVRYIVYRKHSRQVLFELHLSGAGIPLDLGTRRILLGLQRLAFNATGVLLTKHSIYVSIYSGFERISLITILGMMLLTKHLTLST